ncbi:MAG: sigma-54-dependent Fis family transcriptional regulator [Myxococcales bacterium]|nr:sigma-54-dependent Fis family transcriptional regulator [Myxococcales bacterium]
MQKKTPEVLLRLLTISRELTSTTETNLVLQRIMDSAIDVTGAERGFLCLLDEDALEIAVARNLDQEEIQNARKKLSQSIIQKVMATGEPLVSLDAGEDERLAQSKSIHEMRIQSVACIPLKLKPMEAKGRPTVIGCVYLDHRFQAAQFLEADVELLEIFGAHAALAVHNAQLLEILADKNAQLNSRLQDSAAQLVETRSMLKTALAEAKERHELPGIVYASRAMHEVLGLVKRVADRGLPILIEGESGTGKEVLARAIHQISGRASGPFVAVNCGAIPAELFESELFGHRKGAFTGADRDREGLMEAADGGTLFLDEVSELPLQQQVKLLRALQESEVRRVGEEKVRKVNIRVLSACNKPLQVEVDEGRFREDLFYRLRVFQVTLPALRERPEDIPLLVERLLNTHRAILGEGATLPDIDPGVYAILEGYDWPGNIRELENEVKRALALSQGRITKDELSPQILEDSQPGRFSGIGLRPGQNLEDIMAQVEKEVVLQYLEENEWNKSKTAEQLGISRNGLNMKIDRLGLARPK